MVRRCGRNFCSNEQGTWGFSMLIRAALMNFLERFYGMFVSSKREVTVIKLNGKRQDDGYMFIYSPDLKGFSLMLAPEQSRNTGILLAAIHDPLIAYLWTASGRLHRVLQFNIVVDSEYSSAR